MNKTFEQLNDQELVSLNDDQIAFYLKLKKAEAGIRIITLPESPKYQEVPEKDLEIYEVAGYSFREKDKAEEIATVINKHISSGLKVDYDYYNSGSDYKYARPYDGALETVNIIRCYSLPTYSSIKDVINSNKKIKDAWEKIEREFNLEEEKAKEIVDKIYDSIQAARDRLQKFHDYKLRIVEYLQLANGDRDVAWNFFDKAYSVEPSVKTMIMESSEYQEAVNSYIKA